MKTSKPNHQTTNQLTHRPNYQLTHQPTIATYLQNSPVALLAQTLLPYFRQVQCDGFHVGSSLDRKMVPMAKANFHEDCVKWQSDTKQVAEPILQLSCKTNFGMRLTPCMHIYLNWWLLQNLVCCNRLHTKYLAKVPWWAQCNTSWLTPLGENPKHVANPGLNHP